MHATYLKVEIILCLENYATGSSDREMASIGASLLTFWMMAALIIDNIYKGNLKAKLISPRIKLPFTNYRELAAAQAIPIIARSSQFSEFLAVSFLKLDQMSNYIYSIKILMINQRPFLYDPH